MDGRGSRPFILPKIWTVNDFYPTMSQMVFNTLKDCHQIPNNIPIRLPSKFEKCYLSKTADVGMYDAMFTGAKVSVNRVTSSTCQLPWPIHQLDCSKCMENPYWC